MSSSVKGLRDFIIQRVSAVYLAVYAVLMFAYLASHPHLDYQTWKHLFSIFWVQMATIICLVAIMLHAWIGIWTIITDYVKCSIARPVLQLLVIFALVIFFIWGVEIVWGLPLTWVF